MKHRVLIAFTVLTVLLGFGSPALALLDQFVGDSAIYSASSEYLRPSVLLVIDNSAGMRQAGSRDPYNPTIDYSKVVKDGVTTWTGLYSKDTVYERKAGTAGTINYVPYIANITTGVSCTTAKNALNSNGFYAGPLKKADGSCNNPQPGNFFLGNLLNYISYPSSTPKWQANKVYAVGDKVAPNTPVVDANGVALEYVVKAARTADGNPSTSGTSGASEPAWPTTTSGTVTDNTVTWEIEGSIIDMVKTTIKQLVSGFRESVNFGIMVFGDNNAGGKILVPVRNLGTSDPDDSTTIAVDDGPTNYNALLSAVDGFTLLAGNSQPVNETLWDAKLYFSGQNNSTSKIASEKTPYPSPIKYSCQDNLVVLLSTGSTDDNNHTKAYVPDISNPEYADGNVGYVDDAAYLLYQTDLLAGMIGKQSIKTHVIQLLTPEVARLKAAGEVYGGGSYNKVDNNNELIKALAETMANLVMEADTSFVAPVVPTSPENRTYSGERVYLGFFKPMKQKPWRGNLKKYGIDHHNNIVDTRWDASLGRYLNATLEDGSFDDNAVSYWSTSVDGGNVEEGGAGELLRDRNFSADPRQVYTNRGGSSTLTDASNAFNANNITAADLDVADNAARDKLLDYILSGIDSYDDDEDSDTSDRRPWILGDILHSKPQIINYNTYDFNLSNEADPSINKTVIFVGTNDGMLHAFRDADGKELWGFIPDVVVPNLKELAGTKHTYFVDSSPAAYVFDKDNDGNIGPNEAVDGDSDDGSNDKVILIFGLRRGGSAYYAMDVTNPLSPVLLWKITPNTPGDDPVDGTMTQAWQRLGETWSEPQFGKMKIGTAEKIVAFIGGGYDTYEDSRYGNVWYFPATYNSPHQGVGDVASAWTYEPDKVPDGAGYRKTGRAVYLFEVADVTSGLPVVPGSVSLVKAFYFSQYAFASDITVLDTDYNGFVDRLYVGNLGGQMWRFNVGDTNRANWTRVPIFWDSTGAKFFYRPSVTFETGYTFLFFGTGDREHPLNTNVTNRFFAYKDYNSGSVYKLYNQLLDVTGNELQLDSTTSAAINNTLNTLNSSSNYGWYINLNERAGEKVLSSPLAFNKVAYFTTYTPNTVVTPDPCQPGNLGVSRLYAVNYKTGEAVLNFNNAVSTPSTNNDNQSTTNNARARSKDGKVLRRADRSITLGVGIPSGLVVVMPPSGDAELLIGCGGGLCSEDPVAGGTIIPIYWMQW